MKSKRHQRSANVFFIDEGLWGTNTKNRKGWVMKTLETILHENGDDKVSACNIDINLNAKIIYLNMWFATLVLVEELMNFN